MEREGLAPCWLSRVTVVLRRKRENLAQLNFFFFFFLFCSTTFYLLIRLLEADNKKKINAKITK